MIQVTDILVNPMNQVSSNVVIRVEAKDSVSTVVGMRGKAITGSDGSYDFPLLEGRHLIEILFSDEYKVSGEVQVTSSTVTPITLPDLLNLYAYVEPEPPEEEEPAPSPSPVPS